MTRRLGAMLAITLGAGLALGACATASSHRGSVESSRMRMLTDVTAAPQPAGVPDVRYPEVLLAQGIEGTAEVSFVVDIYGSTRDIKVVSASLPEFGEAASAAIRRMQFVPASRNDGRVPCGVGLTFFFRIE